MKRFEIHVIDLIMNNSIQSTKDGHNQVLPYAFLFTLQYGRKDLILLLCDYIDFKREALTHLSSSIVQSQ